MANLEELVIQLSADTKALQADMKSAVQIMGKSTDQMAKAVEGFAKDGAKSTSFFQNAMATMTGYISGQAVIGALNTLKDALIGVVKDGIEGAIEAQEAYVSFANALVRAGTDGNNAAQNFRDFADEMQNLTGITAESTLSVGKLLTSLTGLSGDELQNATKSIMDLSIVMGIDMDTAARMFAKSVNGSGEAFKKFGIEVEDGSDKAERTANTIDALNARFGGSAQAQAKTYAGALKIVKQSFGEVTEEVGNAIVENKAILAVMQEVSKIFLGMSGDLGKNSDGIKVFLGQATKAIFDFGVAAIEVVEFIKPVWDGLGHIFKQVAASIASALILSTQGFTAYKEANKSLEAELAEDWNNIGKASETLSAVKKNFEALAVVAGSATEDMKRGGDVTTEAINKTATSAAKLPRVLTEAQSAMQEWAMTQAGMADSAGEIYELELASLQANFDAKLISEQEYLDQKEAMLLQNIANESAMLDSAAAQGLIKGQELANARLAIDMKANQEQIAMYAQRMKSQETMDKEREANFKSTLGTIAGLASSNSKTLAAIGKAAAISQATIDGYAAVQKALASAPPPFNFALAAAVGAATAGNIAKIVGTPLATGIDEVPGSGFKDNFPAVLAPGERVVPRETNQDLTRFLEMQGGQKGAQINVNVTMNDIFTSDPREMGMKIIETINEAAQANGIQILGSTIR
jgi:hypothetical protein